MKTIELTRGKRAIVDDGDYAFLSQWTWTAQKAECGLWYARRHENGGYYMMHRVLLGLAPGEEADHKNGDGLDNRRENLRRCTRTQNQQNRRKFIFTERLPTSSFKGVYYEPPKASRRVSPWVAQVVVERKKIRRYRQDEESAARAYDELASHFFGEFARLNFPQLEPPK